jgi:hypothetical protein
MISDDPAKTMIPGGTDRPKGTPNKKPEPQAPAKPETNKMEAMRQALGDLGNDAKPLDLQKHLKSKYGVDMDTTLISTYKSTIKKAGQSAVIRRPQRRAKAAAPAAPAPAQQLARAANGGISMEDIKAVKELADRLGTDRVKELAEVLAR